MTYYVSFRSQAVAGSVVDPRLFESRAGSAGLRPVPDIELDRETRGKDVLVATHGFNVNQRKGVTTLGRLEERLRGTENLSAEFFLGVLWPGDYWIPAVNYPAEAGDAVECGKRLAKFCKNRLASARSLSFLSHSLGGRVILETVMRLERRARTVCLTAAAVDHDCLHRQYSTVAENCDALTTLSSVNDMVLRLAYPVGDFISDLFGDDDRPTARALGLKGPKPPRARNVQPSQINDQDDYGHDDYLPPSTPATSATDGKWQRATDYMIRAFRQERQTWP